MKRGKLKKKESDLKKKERDRHPVAKLFLTWISPVGVVVMIVWTILQMVGPLPNQPPTIQNFQLSRETVPVGETVDARVIVKDPNLPDDEIHYFWAAHEGKIGKQLDRFQEAGVTYVAPDQPCIDFITVVVYDGEGETDKDFRPITITERGER